MSSSVATSLERVQTVTGQCQRRGFGIVRVPLGLLLLGAAALKGCAFDVEPATDGGAFLTPALQFLVIVLESLLGLWLLSGSEPLAAWLATTIAFVMFSAVSLYEASVGQASCGCLGTLPLNPWYACGTDLGVVAALLLVRPSLKPLWCRRSEIALTALRIFVVGLFVASAMLGFAYFTYGSLDNAVAMLRNESISVRPGAIDIGEGSAGETREKTVSILNRTDRAIRLVGGTSDCSCMVIAGLPVTLQPRESCSITIQVRLPKSPAIFTHRAGVFVDDLGLSEVRFRLRGRINHKSEMDGTTKAE